MGREGNSRANGCAVCKIGSLICANTAWTQPIGRGHAEQKCYMFKQGHEVKKRGQLGQYKDRWYLITKDRHNGGENSAAGLLVDKTVLVL